MPSAEFFKRFGLFSVENFLDSNFCGSLCKDMSQVPQEIAPVLTPITYEGAVIEEFSRRRELTNIAKEKLDKIEKKMLDLIPQVAKHFRTEITGIETPRPSVYQKGDFFRPHIDVKPDPNAPEFMKRRRASVIIFLNEESPFCKEGTYSGGNLTFYGFIEDEGFKGKGLPLVAEPGLMIAFPPDRTHQVTEVTAGTRYVIVGFYIK